MGELQVRAAGTVPGPLWGSTHAHPSRAAPRRPVCTICQSHWGLFWLGRPPGAAGEAHTEEPVAEWASWWTPPRRGFGERVRGVDGVPKPPAWHPHGQVSSWQQQEVSGEGCAARPQTPPSQAAAGVRTWSLGGDPKNHPRHRGLPGALVSGGQLCRPRGFAPGSRGRGRCLSGVGAARDGPVPLAGGLPGGAGAEVLRCVAHRGAPPACLGQSRPGRSTGSGIQSQVSLPAEGTAEPGPASPACLASQLLSQGLPTNPPGDCWCL